MASESFSGAGGQRVFLATSTTSPLDQYAYVNVTLVSYKEMLLHDMKARFAAYASVKRPELRTIEFAHGATTTLCCVCTTKIRQHGTSTG